MQCSMLFGVWAAETAASREEPSCYRTATGMSAVLSRGTDGFDLFGRELRRAASLAAAARFGFPASKLAGLHIHFFMRTARSPARATSARSSCHPNGGRDLSFFASDHACRRARRTVLHVLNPSVHPFEDALTIGVIADRPLGGARAETLATGQYQGGVCPPKGSVVKILKMAETRDA